MSDSDLNIGENSHSPNPFAKFPSMSHEQQRAQQQSHRRKDSLMKFTQAQRSISGSSRRTRKHRGNRNKQTWATATGAKADANLACTQYRDELETIFGRLDMQADDEWIRDITFREWEGGNWSEWCLQAGATWEDVRTWEPWTEIGESFPAWARRRIEEMRRVREARLIASRLAVSSSAVSISKGDGVPATTLPTSPSDIEAHALLDYALRPGRRYKADRLPLAIYGYSFFNEYEWYWHRNLSGCFELCSWVAHSGSCYCHVYVSCGRWSPEDRVQPYTLDEFLISSCDGAVECGV